MAICAMSKFDHMLAKHPRTKSMKPIAHPERTKTKERERTPPPRAEETKLKILPLRLPFSSLLKVRSKKVRLFEAVGDSSILEGLILMSALALAVVVGDIGEVIAFILSRSGLFPPKPGACSPELPVLIK